MIFAVVEAAEAMRSPIVIQTYPADLDLFPAPHVATLVRSVARTSTVPIALHLDHGPNEALGRTCLAAGFGSVMLDGAADDVAHLIERIRAFAPDVHEAGAALETGADDFGGVEHAKTDPGVVAAMVEAGADLVAVAVGSRHGGDAVFDRAALQAVSRATHAPLVLHGGSGISADDLAFARDHGVVKLNVGSASYRALRTTWNESRSAKSHRAVYAAARDAVRTAALERIEAAGSAGRADRIDLDP